MRHIEQTAVHGIPSGRHIMDVDIPVPACLDLFCRQEELLVKLFV